jgi:FkbM family methyltransferase
MITTKQALSYFNWKNLPMRYAVLDEKFKVKEGDTVIDCGAQYGDISLYMASKVGDTGKVYAIEASPSIFPYLKHNSTALGITNVYPILRAVSNCNEMGRLYGSPSPSGYSILEGTPNQIKDKFERIRCSTLDSIVEEYHIDRVDGIYMNMEGAEYLAIDGMIELIKRFKPFLHIQEHIHDITEEYYYKNSLKSKLRNFGYKIIYDEIGDKKPSEFEKGYSLLIAE